MTTATLQDMLSGQRLLFVTPTTSVHTAACRMADRNVAAVLVIDNGKLWGIFTERDLLRRVVAEGRDPATTQIADVMSTDIVSIGAGRTGFEAYRLMHEFGVRHVVVDGLNDPDGVGYGVVSIRDFRFGELRAFDSELDFEDRVWEEL